MIECLDKLGSDKIQSNELIKKLKFNMKIFSSFFIETLSEFRYKKAITFN